MSCSMEENLTAYLDQELDAPTHDALEAHLPGCTSCRQTLGVLKRGIDTLGALPAYEPSRDTRRKVLAEVDALPLPLRARLSAALRGPRALIPVLGVATAAAVTVAVLARAPHRTPDAAVATPETLELAMNLPVVESYEELQLTDPDDLDVVAHLDELEATP